MSVTSLHIILHRHLNVGDFLAACAALGGECKRDGGGSIQNTVNGHAIRFYVNDGIHCINPDWNNVDMRWISVTSNYTTVSLVFHPQPSRLCAATYANILCKYFGARPSTIANNFELGLGPARPGSDDTLEDVNDFYCFDVATALQQYTYASLVDPAGEEHNRRFQCTRCHQKLTLEQFDPLGRRACIDAFYSMLRNFADGTRVACRQCNNI